MNGPVPAGLDLRIDVPQADLDDPCDRLARTRWPDEFPAPSPVPTGVACFPGDHAIRGLAELSNTITHWTRHRRGGHFASLQAPDLLVGRHPRVLQGPGA
jgi:hypothetical protein